MQIIVWQNASPPQTRGGCSPLGGLPGFSPSGDYFVRSFAEAVWILPLYSTNLHFSIADTLKKRNFFKRLGCKRLDFFFNGRGIRLFYLKKERKYKALAWRSFPG
jgi:hypothetical protein